MPKLSWKQIVLTVLIVALALGVSWYYHNLQAQKIVSGLVSNPADNLTSLDDRVNLVLLGIGGDGHEGSDLTDSIIFVSLNLTSKQVLMVPIPRDVWISSMQAKINTAYHYGKERREGGGRDLIKSAVSEIIGQPVHYALVLDFNGFVRAIDAVGGLDITIDHTFDDYKYPIAGMENAQPESARYLHLHFDQGPTHLDGATALQFVRSRHAEGDEGTDFARSARQEKIITAFRNKVLSSKTLLSSTTMSNLKSSISSSIDTDIGEKEYGSFAKLALSMGTTSAIKNLSLESYLQNPKNTKPYQGQWVLIPLHDLEEIHAYVKANLPN